MTESPVPEGPRAAVPLLETRQITKVYGHVQALRDASLCIGHGEIVGLVGDNGAGKSTLVKILSGVLEPTGGSLYVEGKEAVFKGPLDARASGVETVYQDLALAGNLTVTENLFLGRELLRRRPFTGLGWIDRRSMRAQAERELSRLQIRIGSVNALCGSLSGGQRQAIAVARAVAFGTKVVLMDEPTAALGVEQQERVAALIRQVRDAGTSVLLISHNLPQVHELCDRVVVLYQGRTVADLRPSQAGVEEIIAHITGAALTRSKPGLPIGDCYPGD